jgi:hypothetical protein
MEPYVRNPKCSCARCRAKDLIGAAVVITVGVLLLLHSTGIAYFGQTWPVILLVLGAFLFLGHTASTEGHVQPYGVAAAPVPPQPYGTPGVPVTPQPWSATPPTQPPQQSWDAPGTTTTSTSGEQMPPNDQQVNS